MDTTEYLIQDLMNQETDSFAVICEMMTHSKVELGRQFLCSMNNIVDHFWQEPSYEDINYQIIYLPACPSWSRELLVRFLIHKAAFSF